MAKNSAKKTKLEYVHFSSEDSLKDILDSEPIKEFVEKKKKENDRIYKDMMDAARKQDFEAFKKAYERLK